MRRIAWIVAAAVLAVALPVAVAALQLAAAARAEFPVAAPVAPRPAVHDPARPTAVVVVGEHGTDAADVLTSAEVLAASDRFNVYTVAPSARSVPLNGGLDLVPDLTFAQLDARLGGRAADLVVVPAMLEAGDPAVTAWLRGQAARGSLLESVCVGAQVLAEAGLLDGRPATSHWGQLAGFRDDYPAVRWTSGRRWVDDGDIVTGGGVLSSIDTTLHVVERLAGPAAASAAAAEIGWRYYAPGTPPPPVVSGFEPADAVLALDVAFPLDRPRAAVVLTPGVGEVELASAVETFGGDSHAARLVAVSVDGAPVRSRHGLTFVPRSALAAAAPRLDRVVVPGAQAARAAAVPVVDGLVPDHLHARPGFAFDAAVTDLAASTDVATARWAARAMELPTSGLALTGPAWPWRTVLTVLLAAWFGPALLLRWRSRPRQAPRLPAAVPVHR